METQKNPCKLSHLSDSSFADSHYLVDRNIAQTNKRGEEMQLVDADHVEIIAFDTGSPLANHVLSFFNNVQDRRQAFEAQLLTKRE